MDKGFSTAGFLVGSMALACLAVALGVIGCGSPARNAQKAGAKAAGLPVEKTIEVAGVKMEMVFIPAGEFVMGSPAGEDGHEPQEALHRVRISKAFYMGKYQVTQEQWKAVMRMNPSQFKYSEKLPVDSVSWMECEEFVQKAGQGLRLPTEAEWEYACRAGSVKAFCYGNDCATLEDYAWFKDDSRERTWEVGQKAANAWGLYDMHGNVWEWCLDWLGDYQPDASGVTVDPKGPAEGERRVIRGGGWSSGAENCRCANRSASAPDNHSNNFGFRVVQEIK